MPAADTTLAPCPTEREQDLFEAVFPMPPNCTRFPGGYAPTAYSAWAAHTFCDRWEGWKAARRAQAPAPDACVQLVKQMLSALDEPLYDGRADRYWAAEAAREWLGINGAPNA